MMNKTPVDKIIKDLDISAPEMRRLVKSFASEMKRGLSGARSSLKMIPTYASQPTGEETGEFIALDLGGTNFRILALKLKGRGRIGKPSIMSFKLGQKEISGGGEDLFDFIASRIKLFLSKNNLSGVKHSLGFTFSFPVKQTGIAAGDLVCWTKGFRTKGVIGKDVVWLLNEALIRCGVRNLSISAMLNDTVGTLATKSYEDRNCDIGVIIGTGTNACYSEALANIPGIKDSRSVGGRMIINIEWGNFDKLKKTHFDREIDKRSSNPGKQILEKMVSGMYLGQIAERVIRKTVVSHIRGFTTEHMSRIESDVSKDLSNTGRVLKGLGVKVSTLKVKAEVLNICKAVSLRSARIVAACLGAIILKMDPKILSSHTIAIDGSVYEKHPTFAKNIRAGLKGLFGRKASRVKLVLAKDGSGIGAAITAAAASNNRRYDDEKNSA